MDLQLYPASLPRESLKLIQGLALFHPDRGSRFCVWLALMLEEERKRRESGGRIEPARPSIDIEDWSDQDLAAALTNAYMIDTVTVQDPAAKKFTQSLMVLITFVVSERLRSDRTASASA